MALGRAVGRRSDVLQPLHEYVDHGGRREIAYRRQGDVGVLDLDLYNGAMSTSQCRRLTAALRHAVEQSTKVLLIRGGDVFSNGIHLNVIHAAPSSALEAWRNINAIDDVCREIITCTSQLVVVSIRGNAGAGGVMLALGADRVVARDGVVLNPHYATMGLYGSEYWTYVLPRRVGAGEAANLTAGVPADRRRRGSEHRSRRRRAARRARRVRRCRARRRRATGGPPRPPAAARRQASARVRPMSCTSRSTPTGPRSWPR